ncbi:MAG TPA: helix-turn-helix transcriptional regulator [Roseateles sp.]|nr:helix-turn-helix transcriptional regulator [Roseateles sp.]
MLANKGGKILCVKTLGQLVKDWRLASGLKTAELAALVGGSVKRQHIEQLEKAGSRTPRYIANLAKAMGTTTDDLLALRMPPPLAKRGSRGAVAVRHAAPPAPNGDFTTKPRMATREEVELLNALDLLLDDDRASTIKGIFERAEKQRAHLRRLLSDMTSAKKDDA